MGSSQDWLVAWPRAIKIKVDTTAPQILNSEVQPYQENGNNEYLVKVKISGDTVKLVASSGDSGLLLYPTSDPQTWQGKISVANNKAFGNVNITAYDLAGNISAESLGSLANSTISNYGFLAKANAQVQILGHNLPLEGLKSFYLYFAVTLMIMLVFAIAIHPRVQHLAMIANVSALIILAMFYWVV